MRAVGHAVDVVDRLVFGGVLHVAHFDAAQVLDPAHTLHTGHHQAQGVAVFRAQHFAVHGPSHDAIVHGLVNGDGAGHGRAIGTLGQDVLAVFLVVTAHLQQSGQQHAGEFRAADHAVGVLNGGHRHVAPFGRGVGAAFDEVDARNAGQAHQVVHGEDAFALDQTVDHQAVLGRIDVPPALVVTLKVQAAGRDDAEEALKWRKTDGSRVHAGQTWALAAAQVGFPLAGLTITRVHGHGHAQTGGVLWELQDGIFAFGGDGWGGGACGCGHTGSHGQRCAHEAATGLAGGFELLCTQKVFWCGHNAPNDFTQVCRHLFFLQVGRCWGPDPKA